MWYMHFMQVDESCQTVQKRSIDELRDHKEPRALRKQIQGLLHEEVTLKKHKSQAAKDSGLYS